MSTLFSQKLLKNNEIRPQEADFTEVLESIAVTPKMLYFYGKIPEKQLKSVAIVGTRKPTKYGENVAYRLAYEVAKRGAVVVSGLAYGIDSIAHRGALDAGGLTVAVLGTPIDEIYPKAHLPLAERIVEQGGAVMSELKPGLKKNQDYFPRTCFLERNRIISGLADVVVIPEAAVRSGSLNTAAHALEQGREVFAVPGNIDRPLSQGCNKLIRQGAMPLTGLNDVLGLLFPTKKALKSQKRRLVGDTEVETQLLEAIATGVSDGEEIMAEVRIGAAEFNQTMTMLELKDRIRPLGANQWALK